jgi:ribosomal protein L22
MAEEENEQQEDKPKRRRRRSRGASEETPPSETAPQVSADDASSEAEVEETPADVEAEEAASDVVLEADAEAEGESELETEDDSEDEADEGTEPEAEADDESDAEAPKPARRRRRRGAAAEEEDETLPPAPAPRRRRAQRDPNLPPPVVRAQAKYVRSSARKARLVCDHIRGKTVEEARAILAIAPRSVARDWSKLLESAVANAEHNHELVGEDLYVKAVHADEGPTIKRFRPRAMGRATRIRKRTSHLTILLTPQLREAGGRTKASKRGAGRPAED